MSKGQSNKCRTCGRKVSSGPGGREFCTRECLYISRWRRKRAESLLNQGVDMRVCSRCNHAEIVLGFQEFEKADGCTADGRDYCSRLCFILAEVRREAPLCEVCKKNVTVCGQTVCQSCLRGQFH